MLLLLLLFASSRSLPLPPSSSSSSSSPPLPLSHRRPSRCSSSSTVPHASAPPLQQTADGPVGVSRDQASRSGTVNWEERAARLQEEVDKLRNENRKLAAAHDVKLGRQSTMEQFLGPKRPSEYVAGEMASRWKQFEDQTKGTPFEKETGKRKLSFFNNISEHMDVEDEFKDDEQRSSSSCEDMLDKDTLVNVMKDVSHQASLSAVQMAPTASHFLTMPANNRFGSDEKVPGDFQSFQEAVLKAHRRRNVSEAHSIIVHASKLHDWSGVLAFRTPLSVQGVRSPVMSGAWDLLATSGGLLEGMFLVNEHDSCVTVSGGAWNIFNCSIQSSGQPAIQDPDQLSHQKINTALYCVCDARVQVEWSSLGGLGKAREASWGLFCCAESKAELKLCRFPSCLRLDLFENMVKTAVDGGGKLSIANSSFESNEFALEAGFLAPKSASISLQGVVIKGNKWRNSDRPLSESFVTVNPARKRAL
ncbi:hypothetical protein GUITHDRAFT_147929 [Guillardia theta CCMP2712]|uniref:Uncharacterized protein n=1 Tax=Guillardia theta (strain CCMP2712) TaxID=905079 RepID=L1IBZ0_GUITC|nr:hypothetical protein GUITHDRAFT_147929 [Guillardia theta CCMP2712]EKX33439.1 hypothetical protein GUITHDRAFT_147929 [Guillardia theta CCMP2712]|eukprot:XP_005820419.1 hypothetical protein GUITHDRAFT_147929 [Guillardia theta CCMP2712]